MKICFILLVVILCGCSKTPNPPNDAEIIAYFHQHERQLSRLVALGEKHPALRRAEPALAKYPDFYGQPSAEDLKAQEEAYRILKEIDADFIAWWRTPDGTLNATVPFYRYGLSLGGYSKGLEYISDYRRHPPQSDERMKYLQISESGWFIEESDTR